MILGQGSTLIEHLDIIYFHFDISILTADVKQNVNTWRVILGSNFFAIDGAFLYN